MEPPPGRLVDSEPNIGWTEGQFSVSHDGAAQYSVPLWVPAGRGAVTPQLSLSYSSRAGNGLLGVGWTLSGLSTITWCGRTIAQDGYTDGGHFDGQGGLCLNGNRLVPISPPYSPVREYRTEQETFTKIIAYETQDNVPNFFKVFTKDGKILTLGETADARVQPYMLMGIHQNEPSLVQEPGAPRATTAWVLDRIEDRNGNAATVEYTRTEGDAAGLWWTQLRPSRITYAPNRQVRFIYEEHDRPDPIDGFSGGTHTRTDRRMSRVEMWGGPDGGEQELLRHYRLRYRLNGITLRSLLASVTECDGGDLELESASSATRRCKLPLPFEYSLGRYEFKEIDVGASEPTPVSVVDINGDGRSDLIDAVNGGPDLRVAEGNGFAPPRYSGLPFDTSPLCAANCALPLTTPEILDFGADRRPQAVVSVRDNVPPRYRYQPFKPTNSPERFTPLLGNLGYVHTGFESPPPVYMADLDGNGLPDFVATEFATDKPWSYQLNTGAIGLDRFGPKDETTIRRNITLGNFAMDANGDGRTELISRRDAGELGWASWGLNAACGVQVRLGNAGCDVQVGLLNLTGGRRTTHFGDVNGDGLVDAVIPHGLSSSDPGELRVQLNSGNGFGSRLTAPSPDGYQAPHPYPGSDYLRDDGVRVVDFNGDGRDDVLVFHEGNPGHGDTSRGLQVYTWTDNAFVRAELDLNIGSPSSPNGANWDNTQVLDFDGDGVLDLVNAGTDGRLRVFQRLGGVPDQLIRIGNGSPRGRTEIDYTTLADRDVHSPGNCNFPQTCPISGGSVVAEHRVASDFGPGAEPTWDRYLHKYEAARADRHGRGWLGFAKHTVTRVATGAITVTEFDNVRRDPATKTYPFAHLPKKETYTVKNVNDGTGREFQSITTNDYELRQFDSGTYTVELRHATAIEQERRVGANNWRILRTTKTEASYDDFGNTDVVKSDTTNGRTLTQDFDYNNDPAAWLIGLPNHTLSTGCNSDGVCMTRESRFYYDDKGNPTVSVVEPTRPRLKLTTTTEYGPFGVITSITRTDNAGQSRTDIREYNNADQLHPTDIINAAGHRTVIETHSGLGVPLSTTDPNGVRTTFRYDRFGRLRETNRADGSFEHVTHTNLGDQQLTTTTVAGGGETAVLVDQLGRTRELQVKTFDGRIATTYTDYDPVSRKVSRTSRPTLPDETPQYTVTQYDDRGRVTSVTAPDGAQVRHAFIDRETHTYDAKGVHSYTIDTVDGEVDFLYECATIDMSGCLDDDPASTNWLITDFGYGPFGETTKILFKPDRTAQTIHHDPLGRPDHVRMPSNGTTKTTYNAFGEIDTITDAENRVTTFDEYDQLGRVKKKTSPDGVATNTWDTALHGKGKLAEARSPDGVTIGHTYDELGRDATTTWTIEGTRYEFGYGYDDIGRLDCITYPMIPGATGPQAAERLTVGQVYNPHGYLAQAKDGCQAGGEMYWAAEARNGAGQLERERLGNEVVTTRVYRPTTGLLDRILTTSPDTLGRVAEIGYDYDDNRNVTQRNDQANQRFETYHYDVLNRLDGWSIKTDPAQPGMNTTYAYRPIGNLQTETVQRPNQPEKTTIYRYGEHGTTEHWLTSRNGQQYGYDRTGQQISGPNRTVQYNTSGLPAVLDWTSGEGQVRHTEFAYDPDGARVLKRDADQTVVTVAGLFERRSPAGTGGNEMHNLHNIVADGRVVAQLNRTQDASGAINPVDHVTYLHNDLQRSTIALTNHNGEPIGAAAPSPRGIFYDPFGRRIDAQNDPLDDSRRAGPRQGYTGHEHDDEFGLINMKGRIYDPEARRFLTPDPIQGPTSSQTYNRYSYVQNNPATLTDPTGFVTYPTSGGSGPFNPGSGDGPFTGGTGPFNPGPGCQQFPNCGAGSGWLGGLNGSFSATPTSTDAEPTSSSDDDTSSTAANDSLVNAALAAAADAMCGAPCGGTTGEVIEVQGVAPEDEESFSSGTLGMVGTALDLLDAAQFGSILGPLDAIYDSFYAPFEEPEETVGWVEGLWGLWQGALTGAEAGIAISTAWTAFTHGVSFSAAAEMLASSWVVRATTFGVVATAMIKGGIGYYELFRDLTSERTQNGFDAWAEEVVRRTTPYQGPPSHPVHPARWWESDESVLILEGLGSGGR
ncbi:RHS repeat-associated protein [Kribbella orskensis]|uniref:RHS repeat-associated protein n=2 Tax=Kribbellaceae TaxID=2726069 RepID=A0ABY2BF20_9ACTN|nr:RHS repeat-associated protein [Kribbella sp. VKM Ac-2500]TCO18267.1 RHS repeat-associated protein [Kribbella orskensis]